MLTRMEKKPPHLGKGQAPFSLRVFVLVFLFFFLFLFEWLKSLNSGKMATLIKTMKAKISELFYANRVVRIRQKK